MSVTLRATCVFHAAVRMRRDFADVHRSGRDVDKEENVVRDQTLDRANLDSQNIRRRQTFPVRLQKTLTIECAFRARERVQSVLLQDIGNRAASDPMSQIVQRAADSRVPKLDSRAPFAQRGR